MSESMGKETKQNSSKSDKKNINHIDNSIESQTDGPGSILEIKDLCFAYPEEEKRALNHISFQIKEGEFLVLCGKSGCGKSTLLKHMKTPLTPHGKRKGEILFDGKNLHEMTGREQSQRIGYVLQNPDNQIVTDKVWHELAFGLESLGYFFQKISGCGFSKSFFQYTSGIIQTSICHHLVGKAHFIKLI